MSSPSHAEPGPTPTLERRAPSAAAGPMGLPLLGYASLAFVALLTAKAIAPALLGSATGISGLIAATSFVAACTSQLVAAGGIALSVRLLGTLVSLPRLGIVFRVVMVPMGLCVVALVAAAAARPLEGELGRFLAVAATLAPLSAAPFLIGPPKTRGPGLVLIACALAGAMELFVLELARAAPDSTVFARVNLTFSLLFDVGAAAIAAVWASENARRAERVLGVAAALVLLLSFGALFGERPNAPAALLVLDRSVDAFSRHHSIAGARAVERALSLLPLVLGAALLGLPGRRPELRAALSLTLFGRAGAGTPAAALLAVGGALLAVTLAFDPHAKPERPQHKALD